MRYKIVTVANVICIGIKDRLHQWQLNGQNKLHINHLKPNYVYMYLNI